MDGGDRRADWLTISEDGDPYRPGDDSGRCRFVEVPELVALVQVRMQSLDRPNPFGVIGIEFLGQLAFRDPVAFHLNHLSFEIFQTGMITAPGTMPSASERVPGMPGSPGSRVFR